MPRPKYQKIKKECEQIKALWAKSWDDSQIRQELQMSSSVYETRLKYIARDRFDTNKEFTLLQYQIKKQRRYDQLEAILKTTKTPEMKLKVIQEMNLLDDGFVTMGQRLGVFSEAPKKVAGVFSNTNVDITPDENTDDIREAYQEIVISNTKKMIKNRFLNKKKAKKRIEYKKDKKIKRVKNGD